MNWIPAVVFLVGFLPNCERTPPPEPVQPTDVALADAGSAEPDTSVVAEAPKTGPFLYEVTQEGNHRVSWILGTVNNPHAPVELGLAPESVQLALTRSTHSVFEVPTGSASHRDRTKLMPTKDGSLRKDVGAERFKKLVTLTKHKAGVLDVMHPWVVYLTIEEKLSADPPMDEAYESFSASHRKRAVFLETVHEQVSVLKKYVDAETLSALIDDFEKHTSESEQLAKAYASGDADQVVAAMFPPEDARGQLYLKLVDARVPRWATKLDTQFGKDPTLAIVNVRYLLGPTNIVDALREKGWKVERVAE